MSGQVNRREFLQLTAGGVACLAGAGAFASGAWAAGSGLVSPGCRRSKVKVARVYMGTREGLWPTPKLDFQDEIRVYKAQFAKFGDEMADVDFVVDEVVTSAEGVARVKPRLQEVDGILVIHLSMGTGSILSEILSVGKPTAVFALPYSGHEWVSFGSLQKQPIGAKLECFLTSDYSQLAVAIRPFRAIHHAREAKILNVTTRSFQEYADLMKAKFGTQMTQVDLDTVVRAYEAIDNRDAEAETERWMKGAQEVIEPSRKEVFKSCKLALAFEKMLAEEDATVLTVDCYGTMWDKTIKLPAYPCIGFCRLNDMGLGGICESDLRCAMTHIILQGLTGKPGFISDPTVDESTSSIILAHCWVRAGWMARRGRRRHTRSARSWSARKASRRRSRCGSASRLRRRSSSAPIQCSTLPAGSSMRRSESSTIEAAEPRSPSRWTATLPRSGRTGRMGCTVRPCTATSARSWASSVGTPGSS